MKNIPHLKTILLLLLSLCLLLPLQPALADSTANVTIGTAASSNGAWSGASPDVWTPGDSGVSTVAISEITDRLANSGVVITAGSSITVATAVSWAGSNPLTLNAGTNINVNDAVTWSANKLTLTATNDINVNAVMTASGTSSLDLEPGSGKVNMGLNSSGFYGRVDFSGRSGTGFLTISGQDYTVVQNRTQLEAINTNLAGHYALGGDVDLYGSDWTPLGSMATPFTGVLTGLGHTVRNLTISSAGDFHGLFGLNQGTLENVQTYMNSGYNSMINGGSYIGALAGANDTGGIIRNVVAMFDDGIGIVGSGQYVGGLVGFNSGTIVNAHVVSSGNAGDWAMINGDGSVGGLVGQNEGAVYNSSASNFVIGGYGTDPSGGFGGLVGQNNGAIAGCYASGRVVPNRTQWVGGLVGVMFLGGASIADSYATGTVGSATSGWSDSIVGGLVGYMAPGTSVTNSYATAAVAGSSLVGGLVGQRFYVTTPPPVTNSFWDTANYATSDGGTGLPTEQMKTASNFSSAGWSISSTGGSSAIWRIYEGNTYPLLRSFLTPMSVTANNAAKNYDTTPYSGGNGVQYAPTGYNPARVAGTLAYGGTAQGATAIGSYTITLDGLFSDQLGYDIAFVSGVLNINGYWLTLGISGSGTVNSSNGSGLGYACNTATCSAVPFGSNDTVTLTATGSNATFSSWSGDYVSSSNPGSITMGANKAVTATFSPAPATVKVDGDSTPYYSINSALAAPTQDTVIRATATGFVENVTMQNSHTLTLKGGYSDNGFTSQTGYSSISGR
jgi:hypothetical protein